MLKKYFGNTGVEIIFVGHQISGAYVSELIEYLKDKEFAINVISKSGTTTEPAIAFRIFKELIEARYGVEESKNRIYATTDKARGALKGEANQKGYQTFVIPDDIGGRYSVFTAVGLLPIAAAGYDIDELMQGARDSSLASYSKPYFDNPALLYAATRKVLLDKEAANSAKDLVNNFEEVNGCHLLVKVINGNREALLKSMDILKTVHNDSLIVLIGNDDGSHPLVCSLGQEMLAKGLKAGNIVKEITQILGGSGGGRPDMASGAVKDISKIDEVIAKITSLLA